MTTGVESDAAAERRLRDQLVALPGVELVLWSGVDLGNGSTGDASLARPWLRVLAALAVRLCEELGRGRPRALTLSGDDYTIALAIDPVGAILAVLSRDPDIMDTTLPKLRAWQELRSRRWNE